jgi:hypothetical protein
MWDIWKKHLQSSLNFPCLSSNSLLGWWQTQGVLHTLPIDMNRRNHSRIGMVSTDTAMHVDEQCGCSCNRTDQIIRAQVQKQAPKHSNFWTWAHIIPVVNRNHKGFQTNLFTTKIASFNITHHTLHFTSSSESTYNTWSHKLLQTEFIK